MELQAAKQWLVASEQLGQRIDKQTLAETAGAGEEVVRAFLEQMQGNTRLVNVVAVILADVREVLDTNGQLLAGHDRHRDELCGECSLLAAVRGRSVCTSKEPV